MGYYSDVRIKTTPKGYERFKELIPDDERWFVTVGYCGFDHVEHDDTVVFGWSEVKWYEDYREVNAVTDALDTIVREGHPVKYIRIGENIEDIEIREHNTADPV